jgi:hypothetical protein
MAASWCPHHKMLANSCSIRSSSVGQQLQERGQGRVAAGATGGGFDLYIWVPTSGQIPLSLTQTPGTLAPCGPPERSSLSLSVHLDQSTRTLLPQGMTAGMRMLSGWAQVSCRQAAGLFQRLDPGVYDQRVVCMPGKGPCWFPLPHASMQRCVCFSEGRWQELLLRAASVSGLLLLLVLYHACVWVVPPMCDISLSPWASNLVWQPPSPAHSPQLRQLPAAVYIYIACECSCWCYSEAPA